MEDINYQEIQLGIILTMNADMSLTKEDIETCVRGDLMSITDNTHTGDHENSRSLRTVEFNNITVLEEVDIYLKGKTLVMGEAMSEVKPKTIAEIKDARKQEEIIEAVARAFSRDLLEEIGPEFYYIAQNSHLTPKGPCGTHNYCDANLVMFGAFKDVTAYNGESEQEHVDIYNKAWELAREKNFYVIGTAAYHEWYDHLELNEE